MNATSTPVPEIESRRDANGKIHAYSQVTGRPLCGHAAASHLEPSPDLAQTRPTCGTCLRLDPRPVSNRRLLARIADSRALREAPQPAQAPRPKVCPRCGLATAQGHAITDDLDECLDALRTALGPFLDWGRAVNRPEAPGPLAVLEYKARRHASYLAHLRDKK